MQNTNNEGNNFLIGAFIIALSNIIIKIIGAAYKIPLDGLILKTEGMGIYSSAYTIYNTLFIISTAGIPVAISKMVSEARVLKRYNQADKIFSISKKLLFAVGLTAALTMFFGSYKFARLIAAPQSYLTMMAMSPSLFFVSLISCYRGFYQGEKNMIPTAVSEVIEALCKLIFGLSLAYIFMKAYGKAYIGSAGAILGITIGSVGSFIFLFIYDKIKRRDSKAEKKTDTPESTSKILYKLITLAVPVTLGVSVFTLTSVVDTAMVMNQLKNLGFDEGLRESLYGYLNRAITLFNLPPTVIAAIAISIVPAIASALAINNKTEANKNVSSALRITILFALPCAIGLSVLAEPILLLLYRDPKHSFLLNIMGIAVLFVTLVQVGNAIIQAYGKPWIPVLNMLIGGIIKVAVNLILVSQKSININGAPIGTMLCYFTVMTLNLIYIKRVTKIKFSFAMFVLKPVICGGIAGIVAYSSYGLASLVFGNTISVFISIGTTAIIYFTSVLLIKGVTRDDILLLPKGEKIEKIFTKFKLL